MFCPLTYKVLYDVGPLVGLVLQLLNVLLHRPDLVQRNLDVLALEGLDAERQLHQVRSVLLQRNSTGLKDY